MIIEGARAPADIEDAADFVVVGSGAGGAVVAAHLAESGRSVIVVEEGRHFSPQTYGRMRPSESLRHMWRDGGTTLAVGLGDTPFINVMMGRCVGGSSVLTGGVCFRTPPSVLQRWSRDLALTDLSEEQMEPYFDDVEHAVHVETVPQAMRSRSTELFDLGARRRGHPLRPLRRNTRGCVGRGRCNFGCPEGAKLSVDQTYLPRALACGARVYTDCRAHHVLVHGSRAAGITGRILSGPLRRPAGTFRIRARHVVLAAGAFATPALLLRTGVGRRSGQLGRNLTLHPGFRIMARFDERVNGWNGALQSAFSDRFESEGITLVGLFVPPGVLAATLPGVGPEHTERARLVPHLSVFGGMIHDAGGGRVHHALGKRWMTYRMSAADRAAIPQLLTHVAETYFAAGAREVYLPVFGLGGCDADRFRSLDLAALPARKLECTSQHPLGSARMGADADASVVDPDGETWDLPGLFVADGSTVPTSLGVNPQETIMALATRVAWKLRELK